MIEPLPVQPLGCKVATKSVNSPGPLSAAAIAWRSCSEESGSACSDVAVFFFRARNCDEAREPLKVVDHPECFCAMLCAFYWLG